MKDKVPRTRRPIASWWYYVVGAFLGVWVIIFLTANSDSTKNMLVLQNYKSERTNTRAANTTVELPPPDWNDVNTEGLRTYYTEVSDTAIHVVVKESYTLYFLKENLLFSQNKNTFITPAIDRLMQIKNSLKKHYKDANIGVYGNSDTTLTVAENKDLSNNRAETVKGWLRVNNINEDYVSIHSLIDKKVDPDADRPRKGRYENSDLVIVAFPDKSAPN